MEQAIDTFRDQIRHIDELTETIRKQNVNQKLLWATLAGVILVVAAVIGVGAYTYQQDKDNEARLVEQALEAAEDRAAILAENLTIACQQRNASTSIFFTVFHQIADFIEGRSASPEGSDFANDLRAVLRDAQLQAYVDCNDDSVVDNADYPDNRQPSEE